MRDAPALARRAVSGHMWSMSGRPCNPGSDLRQLWQALLGKNTPFPQCGVPERPDTSQKTDAARDDEQPTAREPAGAQRGR